MNKIVSGIVGVISGLSIGAHAYAANITEVLDAKRYVIDRGIEEVYHGWRHHRLLVKGSQIGYKNPDANVLLLTGAVEQTGLWVIVQEEMGDNMARDLHIIDSLGVGKVKSGGFEIYETNPHNHIQSIIYDFRKKKDLKDPYQNDYDAVIRGVNVHKPNNRVSDKK